VKREEGVLGLVRHCSPKRTELKGYEEIETKNLKSIGSSSYSGSLPVQIVSIVWMRRRQGKTAVAVFDVDVFDYGCAFGEGERAIREDWCRSHGCKSLQFRR